MKRIFDRNLSATLHSLINMINFHSWPKSVQRLSVGASSSSSLFSAHICTLMISKVIFLTDVEEAAAFRFHFYQFYQLSMLSEMAKP